MRTVPVKLRLIVDDVVSGVNKARGSVRGFGQEIQGATGKSSQGFQTLGRGALVAGGAIAFGLGKAIGASMTFDKSMSAVAAVSGATAIDMGKLRQAALDAGEATVFSATESADAEAELARAGVNTADILGGALRGSLDLAAAGQLGLADAATISAQAMNVFKLRGQDVAHIADVLAAGANKSAADVGQLGDALRQGGLVAAQTGLKLEDTVGVLSAFADRALIGSDAGTSLKTMLQRLTPQSAEAASEMERLGISAYDASGQFVGIDKFAQNLKDSLSQLTVEQRNTALATIFGSDAVRAANVLYELGGQGVRDYTKAVNDQGAAQRMAQIQTDNLSGDLERLSGTVQTTLIESGSSANSVLRTMTQTLTSVVGAYNGLPGPAQAAVTGLTATAGAIALVGGAALIALPRIVATKAALDSLGISAAGMAGKLGLIGGVAIGSLVGLEALRSGLDGVEESLQNNEDANTAAVGALGALRFSFVGAALGLDGNKKATDEAKKATEAHSVASQAAAQTQAAMRKAIEESTPEVDLYAESIQRLHDELAGLNDVHIDAQQAAIDFQAALDDASKSVKDNGKTLDINTDKGRANKEALLNIARAAKTQADAILDETGSEKKFRDSLSQSRTSLINTAIKMGMTKTEAQKLANKILGIPKAHHTKVTIGGVAAAKGQLMSYTEMINGIPRTVTTTVYAQTLRMGGPKLERGGLVPSFQHGGRVAGQPGPDRVNIDATAGEFVVNARDTARTLPLLEAINRGRVVPGGSDGATLAGMGGRGWDGRITLDVRSGHSPLDQVLAGIITEYVRVNGSGDVQAAFGRRRGR